MSRATVRISPAVRDVLRKLAAQSGESMQAVMEKAIETYRRQCFLEEANAAYATLRNDPQAWQAELEERKEWEATLADDEEDQ